MTTESRAIANTNSTKMAVQCSVDTFLLIKVWFSASSFVLKIGAFVKPQNVISHFKTT